MAVTRRSASRCTTQDAKEARARAQSAKLASLRIDSTFPLMSRLLAGATSPDNGRSSGPIFSAARTLIRISTPPPTGDIASREPQLMELQAAGSSDDRGIDRKSVV